MSALGSRAVSGAAGAAGAARFVGTGRRHVLGWLAAGLGGVVAAPALHRKGPAVPARAPSR